jgi:hypothetical protein
VTRTRQALFLVAGLLAARPAGAQEETPKEQPRVRWRDIREIEGDGTSPATPERGRNLKDDTAKSTVDTSYGRVDGDLSVSFGLGATVGPRSPRASADLRFRYMDTVGIFGTYEDGPLLGSGSEPRRVLATGVELRPLFIARWLTGREFGVPHLDLALDSFGLELGAFFAQPDGAAFAARPGLQAGLGLEVPVLPHSNGPWIGFHGGARWSDTALGGSGTEGPVDRSLYLGITVAWHQFFGGHVVDLGDRASR